jgi:hypothetical protein
MNSINDAIKDFAVNVLGCACPDEVFSSIKLEKNPMLIGGFEPSFAIRIGGRLMILGFAGEMIRSRVDSLAAIVAEGIRIRDGEKFNRLRIVAISDDPESDEAIRAGFARIAGLDDRVHMHVVKKDVIDMMLAGRETGAGAKGRTNGLITKPTVWHEMEGPFIGGREHYQEKSYGFDFPQGAETAEEAPGNAETEEPREE